MSGRCQELKQGADVSKRGHSEEEGAGDCGVWQRARGGGASGHLRGVVGVVLRGDLEDGGGDLVVLVELAADLIGHLKAAVGAKRRGYARCG